MNWMDLVSVLAWIAGGSGAGLLSFKMMNWITWQPAQSELKRYASLAMAVVLAWAAWFVLAWLGVETLPAIPQDWLVKLFAIAAPAIIAGQALHGATSLRAADIKERKLNERLDG
jgi:hypothetical protein